MEEDDAKSTKLDHSGSARAEGASSIKLPKLSISKFDGASLPENTLKDSPAERVIQGLAQMADTHNDAIECLLNRYDRPRLIHQAHVCAIIDVPSLKEGNGKEIGCLHDVSNITENSKPGMKISLRSCSLAS